MVGASRGLGRQVLELLLKNDKVFVQNLSRRPPLDLREQGCFSHLNFDLNGVQDFSSVLGQRPWNKVIYFAGGGPFGPFGSKSFKDHEWAWKVSFLGAALLLHQIVQGHDRSPMPTTILLGSAVAESSPDPGASSYCAAKHALRGLVTTLQKEYPHWDLRMFSPGYMKTDLLRGAEDLLRKGIEVRDPAAVAQEFLDWILQGTLDGK